MKYETKIEKILNFFLIKFIIESLVILYWIITGYRYCEENSWKTRWRKITGQKEITVWKCKNDKGIFQYNHFEFGHLKNKFPTPKFPNQKSWLNKEWSYEHCYLTKKNTIVRMYE